MTILDYTATKHEDGGVRITINSPHLDWKEARFPHTTVEQMAAGAAAYAGGKLIHQAYPFLTPSEREFLMTGMTDDEWNEVFAAAEQAEDDGPDTDGLDLDAMIAHLDAAGITVRILDTPEEIDKFFEERAAEAKAAELDAMCREDSDEDEESDDESDLDICPECGEEFIARPSGVCPACESETGRCPICNRDGCPGYCESGYGVR